MEIFINLEGDVAYFHIWYFPFWKLTWAQSEKRHLLRSFKVFKKTQYWPVGIARVFLLGFNESEATIVC